VTENTTWSSGDYDHALYMVKNDLVTHYETPGTPYYTTDGDLAARNSNIYVSSTTSTTDESAIDWWMAAPFHELGMMDPRLTTTGFGSYREVKSGWDMGAALDVLRGNSFSGGTYPVFFPGNGSSEPLTSYGGNEFPDPLQACPGYAAPTGIPVTIQVGGNVATTAGAVHSFTGNGVPLAHCVIDSNTPNVGSGLTSRGAVIVIPQQPLQSGVNYVVSLTVNGVPYTWSFTVGPFNTCSVALSASPPAVAVGATVTLTAQATGCPNANPLFQFWMAAPGGSWQIVQPYSTNSTFTWNTSAPAGTYSISVWVRDAMSAGIFGNNMGRWDAYSTVQYTLNAYQCASVSFSASPVGSAAEGAPVTLTAGAAGCPSPLYQFWMAAPGGGWQIVQAYSTSSTFNWSTTGAVAGTYSVSVWVRDAASVGATADSGGRYDARSSGFYTLTSTPCSAAGYSVSPASSAASGTPVTITASSSGCPNPLYQFWMAAPGGSWQMMQAYSTSPTLNWSTTGGAAGTYSLSVWVRDASSIGTTADGGGRYDARSSGSYALVKPCSAVSYAFSPASPAKAGTSVTITASASGCANPLYQFWMAAPGGSWQMVQAYSTSPTFNWSTSGAAAGTYSLSVWVRDASSIGTTADGGGRYDARSSGFYALTSTPCSASSYAVSPASPVKAGTPVTITASSSGCPNPLYQFWMAAPGGGWQIVQAYSTSPTFNWSTTAAVAGTYSLSVWVRDASSIGTTADGGGRYDTRSSSAYSLQ